MSIFTEKGHTCTEIVDKTQEICLGSGTYDSVHMCHLLTVDASWNGKMYFTMYMYLQVRVAPYILTV